MTDPFVQAGLMARAGLEANAAFAGVFGASPQVGSFFESRASLAANAMTAAPVGGFPVNYPQTWLRLRRAGSAFTGFGSLDGKTWVQLGTATITTPTVVYVGLAVTSGKQEKTALAQLRNYGNTVSTLIGTYVPRGEPIGPSNRRTGLVFSEIMYHPKNPAGISNRLEYIEIYNADSIFEDLGGSTLSGGISYTFPPLFRLEAGEYVVIAAEPAAIRSVYGITNVVGPFVGKLDGAGDTLRFSDEQGAIKLEMTYSPNSPWPIAADGTGHSLTLNRPSYGENDPRAWGLSARIGGSPGAQDVLLNTTPNTVVINEFLAHTDDPVFDFIEL
ncbi:MAG: lamin tail domain-containing protein, partial [Verrucomicrobia bacterium]|nr:lamin tail domain-containing protein [Verrucomicrobiota bacterium]